MPADTVYFVYVLRNDAGTTYTGIALDVKARLSAHNDGTGAKFTRGRGPWTVIHTEGPPAPWRRSAPGNGNQERPEVQGGSQNNLMLSLSKYAVVALILRQAQDEG